MYKNINILIKQYILYALNHRFPNVVIVKKQPKRNTRHSVKKDEKFFKKSVDFWIFIWYYYKAVAKRSAVNLAI